MDCVTAPSSAVRAAGPASGVDRGQNASVAWDALRGSYAGFSSCVPLKAACCVTLQCSTSGQCLRSHLRRSKLPEVKPSENSSTASSIYVPPGRGPSRRTWNRKDETEEQQQKPDPLHFPGTSRNEHLANSIAKPTAVPAASTAPPATAGPDSSTSVAVSGTEASAVHCSWLRYLESFLESAPNCSTLLKLKFPLDPHCKHRISI